MCLAWREQSQDMHPQSPSPTRIVWRPTSSTSRKPNQCFLITERSSISLAWISPLFDQKPFQLRICQSFQLEVLLVMSGSLSLGERMLLASGSAWGNPCLENTKLYPKRRWLKILQNPILVDTGLQSSAFSLDAYFVCLLMRNSDCVYGINVSMKLEAAQLKRAVR